ncbi:hypothetical protein ACWFPY_24305 [Nocardia fluminea]
MSSRERFLAGAGMRDSRIIRSILVEQRWGSRFRGLLALAGLAVVVIGLIGAVFPAQETLRFQQAVRCERGGGGCLDREIVTISDRRTWEVTSTSGGGGDSPSSTTTDTYYEITWRRADGSHESEDVESFIFDLAHEGQPATLRRWHGEVVAVEVASRTEWFLPNSAGLLGLELWVVFFGGGILLWGLYGWWDGFFFLAYRAGCWAMAGIAPAAGLTHILAYGVDISIGLVGATIIGLVFTAISLFMLGTTLDRRRLWL